MTPCQPATSKAPTFGVSHKSSSGRGEKAATAGTAIFMAAHRRQGVRGRDGERRENIIRFSALSRVDGGELAIQVEGRLKFGLGKKNMKINTSRSK